MAIAAKDLLTTGRPSALNVRMLRLVCGNDDCKVTI